MVFALVGDLLFRSKIEAIAGACGVAVRTALPSEAVELPAEATRVLVDLTASGDPFAVIERFRAADAEIEIVGFFPHVETDLKRRALAAGATRVLPRGTFVERLPEMLLEGSEGAREPGSQARG